LVRKYKGVDENGKKTKFGDASYRNGRINDFDLFDFKSL